MPRSGAERLLVAVGVAVLAAVGVLALRGWQGYRDGSMTATTVAVTHASRTPERRRAAAAARSHTLVLRAAGGASWLSVRSRGAAGRLLYQGILAPGRSLRLAARRFWVRAGAAANLTASFDGRPVRGFPTGTATMTIAAGVARIVG